MTGVGRRWGFALALAFLLLGCLISWQMVWHGDEGTPSRNAQIGEHSTIESQIQQFCGACHLVPSPDLLPRESWAEEIPKAYGRYKASGRRDLTVPDQATVIAFYTQSAPANVVIPPAPESKPGSIAFQREFVDLRPGDQGVAVSYLSAEQSILPDGQPTSGLLLCDMGNGWVQRFDWKPSQRASPLCRLRNPDHVVACDVDKDGRRDYLVADLGTLKPSDDLRGAVVLLRQQERSDQWDAVPILEGLGRVADVQPADVDGDGDTDLIVAEFGFEKVGRVLWLETLSIVEGQPNVRLHEIDPRHGAIHICVTDFEDDGDSDFIALISQEHEAIVAFLNDGRGAFQPRTLFQADNPSFGSSGMELVDLDGDRDFDLLFTNGDTLDTFQLRPSHAVNVLENQGGGEFLHRQLAVMPGAVRAVAADLDLDGDQDVAAVAFCPPMLRHMVRPSRLDTFLWLEQVEPGRFERHSLEQAEIGHMAIAAGDYDGDGDFDLAVGEFSPFTPQSRRWFTLYWNQLH